ncbi:MAG: 2Fe-2S iron-sulfur cluster-binding protein [Gaiellales bacterium]
MTELVTITIDGRELQVPRGTGMVEAALSAGIEIPVFCYEPRLGAPLGACRMCLCEVEGLPKLQAACTLTAQDGMVLRTAQASERAAFGQNAVLEFILLNHPLDCPDCDKGGECPLQDLTFRYGPGTTRMVFPKRTFDKPIPISPLIALDRERCILCYRCTRFSEGVAEDGQLVAVNRSRQTYITTFEDEPYRTPFSGNVIELCPVGALTSTVYRFRGRPWEIQNVPTVCGLCPVGCNTWATTREGKVARILGRNHPELDEGWLCDKGRFAHDHLAAGDRIRNPILRVPLKGLTDVTWEQALDAAEEALRAAEGEVVVAFSGGETVEQAAAVSRLVLEGLGTGTALLPDDPDPALDAFRAPLSAIRSAGLCAVIGDEPVVERAPLVDLWLRAARRAGAEVVTVHPAGTVPVAPGSAARVCAELAGSSPSDELLALHRKLREAERVALVWSEDDPTGGRRIAALASALGLGEGSGVYWLPRTPNAHGVARAWHAAGGGPAAAPAADAEIGVLIVSGDEAVTDPRVVDLADRARFVLTTSMFMNEVTGQSHLVLPGTSYLERDGTTVNLEGRPQRLRPAVTPPGRDELAFFATLARRFGIEIGPWPSVGVEATAPLPARTLQRPVEMPPVSQPAPSGPGLRLLRYRPLFRGEAVARISQLQFQRPEAEVELSAADARELDVRSGDPVVVGSNGSSRSLRARVNRRLLAGVVRIADEHAHGLGPDVELTKVER